MSEDLKGQVTILKCTSAIAPKASILCSTYNHGDYIAQTIESLLDQDTEFEYEIVVHDDASTDSTQAILKKYYEKYSDKLTIVFQQKNQYSKGHFEPTLAGVKYAKSDVLLLCEGDDYWISNKKLQYQVDRYEAYPEIDLVFHPVYQEYPDGKRKMFCRHSEDEWVVPAKRIIRGTGGFCPTVSLLISRRALLNIPSSVLDVMSAGDVFIQIYGAVRGGALFLPEPYAVYRVDSSTSVSTKLSNASIELRCKSNNEMAAAYEMARKDLPFKFYFALTKMARKYRIKKNKKLRKI